MIRKILAPVERNRCMVLFISHETANMEMYSGEIKTKGGKAVPDASSQRIRLKNLSSGKIKNDDGELIGQNVCCTVVKNNQGVPYRSVDVPLIFGQGINRSLDLLQICVELAIIEKKGSWFTCYYGDEPKKCRETEVLERITKDAEYRAQLVARVDEIL